ncbi:MAG: DUF2202 domain-containing protein [Anaerolineales bacterium]
MKQNFKKHLMIIGLLLVTMLSLQACSLTSASAETIRTGNNQTIKTDENSDSLAAQQQAQNASNNTIASEKRDPVVGDSTELSEEEINSLVFMREEEKLAHDVYVAMYDLWGLPLFQNIAKSEQTHMDAIKGLLDTYHIPDPADNSLTGVFQDSHLQSLYDELVDLGAKSLSDALKVGAAIEEIDILDLQESLEFVNNNAVRQVYENLLKGSENHLRAFTNTLEKETGEVYTPQYLSEDAYDEIVSSPANRGTQGGSGQMNSQPESDSRGSGRRGNQNRP